MSFADLEAGSLRAPLSRKARGGGNDARGLVFQITTAVASYRHLLNSLGTPKDTPTLRDQLQRTSQNILQLAKDAKDKLQKAAEADKSIDTSADKRVADTKLAKDFAATMEEFRKLQNLAIQRETAYKPVISSYTTDDRSAEPGNVPEQRALLAESKRQEVLQLDNEIVFNEAIIEEREQAIQEIQQQIGEVREVFKDLATLVHAQGIIIEEIDMNIENSAEATKEAKREVAKADKTQEIKLFPALLAYGHLWGRAACCDSSFGSLRQAIFHPATLFCGVQCISEYDSCLTAMLCAKNSQRILESILNVS